MKAAFSGWQSDVSLVRITQTIVNGLVTDAEEAIKFKGVVQPLKPEAIALKPEGLRSWEWLQIHAFKDSPLKTGEVILHDGRRFKVMEMKDYSLNNYIEYHVVEDYE